MHNDKPIVASTASAVKTKKAESELIQSQIDSFLASGNTIKQCASSDYKPLLNGQEYWKGKKTLRFSKNKREKN